MPECQTIRLKHKKLCAGDLDRRVCVYSRNLDAPGETVDYENSFVKRHTVWSGMKTTKGRQMFYATNEDKAVTHVFYLRYIECLTSQEWIQYKSEYYDIIDIENIDERNEWMAVFCNVRGDSEAELNYA